MTSQIHERLILNGELLSLTCTPPIPKHPRIICMDEEKKVNWDDYSPIVFSTACWRRYIGTWEIRDRRFYLRDIEGIYQMTGDEPVFVDEYSGTLRAPFGQRVWVINVKAGCVVDVWEESNSLEESHILSHILNFAGARQYDRPGRGDRSLVIAESVRRRNRD